jgi:hypothetical protein
MICSTRCATSQADEARSGESAHSAVTDFSRWLQSSVSRAASPPPFAVRTVPRLATSRRNRGGGPPSNRRLPPARQRWSSRRRSRPAPCPGRSAACAGLLVARLAHSSRSCRITMTATANNAAPAAQIQTTRPIAERTANGGAVDAPCGRTRRGPQAGRNLVACIGWLATRDAASTAPRSRSTSGAAAALLTGGRVRVPSLLVGVSFRPAGQCDTSGPSASRPPRGRLAAERHLHRSHPGAPAGRR